MQLTFDMFSGRTNPSWRLPPMVSRQVFDLIGDSGLLPWISSELFPARLGYRGLQIVLPPEVVQKYRVSPWLNLSADAFGHVELFKELAAIARFAGFFGFDEFQKLVRTIRRDRAATVLLCTHDLEEAEVLCDHVLVLDQGRVLAEGTPAELIHAHAGEVGGSLEDAFMTLTGKRLEEDEEEKDE